MKIKITCPPRLFINVFLTVILCFITIGICLYSFDPKDFDIVNCTSRLSQNTTHIANNNKCDKGNLLGLLVLYIGCTIGGILIVYIKFPPLLGMLIIGFALRNTPYINVAIFINKLWSGNLRNMALMIILIRAGLGLDPKVLKRLSFVVVRLAFTPCIIEAITEAIVSHFLIGLSWSWAFMLGFILSAVSPAVVVPSVLELEKKGLGVDQGINTLVIAAASIDDVLAITGFGICLGFSFSDNQNLALQILSGPLEALAGIMFGIILGIVSWYIPSSDNDNFIFYRSVLLYLLSIVSMFGSIAFKIPGAGALGVLTLAFVTGFGWSKDSDWNGKRNPVTKLTELLWWLFQPFLFGLIGAGLDINSINFSALGFGIVTLLIGIVFRLLASFFSVFGTKFTMKERLFIPIAWLPKATVQAALGPVALDLAIKNNLPQHIIDQGDLILAIAAMAILITAPIGAALISLLAPLLLQKSLKSSLNEADVVKLKTIATSETKFSSTDEK